MNPGLIVKGSVAPPIAAEETKLIARAGSQRDTLAALAASRERRAKNLKPNKRRAS